MKMFGALILRRSSEMNPAVTSAHFSTESAARAAHEHRFPLGETVTFSGDHDDQKQQELIP